MASLVPTIRDKEFQNWLRGALALLFTKQGLEDFVTDELTHFQTDLLKKIFTNKNKPFGTDCSMCTTENVLPCPTKNFCPIGRRCNLHDPAQQDKSPNRVCPNNICKDIREAIRREHKNNGPSWKNTNASKWCTNSFQIAKCFMPPDGYSAVTTFADTDFNGILAVIINNKRFQNKLAAQLHQQNNVCIEAREVGRVIRHSADLCITDADLAKHIDTLITLLSDPKYLVAHQKAKEAVDKLKQLKSNQLSITTSDILLVIDNALKDIIIKRRDNALQAIIVEKDEANRVIEDKTNASVKLLGDVKDSLAHTQTLTVSSLNQIATAKLSALGDILDVSKDERHELAATATREIQLLQAEIISISAKEQQEVAATGTRERQLVSEEIKSMSAKEQQELAATGTREKQLVSEEIESISVMEQQELAAKGTRERQLVGEKIKSLSAQVQQELAAIGTRERQIVSEEIKSISANEQQELVATGTRERQLISGEIRNVSDEERKDLAATGTKEKQQAIDEIRQLSVKEKKELLAVASNERELIREECRKGNDCHQQTEVSNTSRTQEQLEKSLRQDLITFYRDYHSTIPIAPLVEETDVPLVDFYVQPPLTATDTISGQLEEAPTKRPVHSYRNLLLREDGDFYKNIYITAKAGIGKTSFSKRICMAWCQANIPLQKLEQKFEPDDLEVMKQFEYLFFIPLRDTDASECDVDNMIYKQVISNLTGSHRYTEYFIKDLLHDRSCLIVLDGLDEWTHPESCRRYRNVHELPHTRARQRCSVITTTRPWKLDVAQVSLNKIDRLVEINELNKSSSRRLISNAVILLNKKRLQKQAKSVEEFQQITSSTNLDAIKYIPYILLQMICLWFDGKSVGKSKCEIYSNILELTFARSLIKTGDSSLYPRPKQQAALTASIPPCLSCNELCTIHFDVVLTVAKLAFETLFMLNKESSLVFSKAEVLHSISEEMVELLLKTGLISQNKDYGRVASRQSKCSFQHKSIQEYFAALYIYSKHDSEPVQQRIGQVCNTLATVLEMSSIFVFLSGFSSDACGKILQMLHKTVSTDMAIKYYRSKIVQRFYERSEDRWFDKAVTYFQSMQADIVQEIIQNERGDFPSRTEDVVIQYSRHKDSFHLLKPLIENSKAKIKSLCIEHCSCEQECSEVLDTFGLQKVKRLRMLRVRAIPRQRDLQRLLSESVHSLECLQIIFSVYRNNRLNRESTNTSPEIVRLICNMDHLLALSLGGAGLTCPDVEVLFNYLSKRTVMTEISLVSIFCRSGEKCSGHCLDLSKHQNLSRLEMHVTTGKSVKSVSKLSFNTSSLETCHIGRLLNGVYSSLLQSLLHATNLRVLVLRHRFAALTFTLEMLPNLINLKQLQICQADLGDSAITVPSVMKTLEYILFHKVKMTSSALRNCIDSANVLQQSVTIRLIGCTVDSEQEYQQLKDDLRASQKCKIKVYARNQDVFDFQTVGYGT